MATYQGQTVDIYEDAEDGTLATFVETDTGSRLTLADADQYWGGTHSHEINHTDSTAEASLSITGVNYSTISVGFAYRSPVSVTWNWGPRILKFIDSAWAVSHINFGREAGDTNATGFSLNAATANFIGASDSTWYWITAQYVRNTGITYRIYNAAHEQVGSDLEDGADDTNVIELYFGSTDETATSASYSYIDDIVVDYTDGTFPLLGWEVGGGGSIVPQAMMYYMNQRAKNARHNTDDEEGF